LTGGLCDDARHLEPIPTGNEILRVGPLTGGFLSDSEMGSAGRWNFFRQLSFCASGTDFSQVSEFPLKGDVRHDRSDGINLIASFFEL
jgi:hypothetical protein